ncbi:MAG: hypothetical protein NTW49_06360 [Bacteroidia bacterium]|nr:hypothetical protein [Bacteroidia bacterium]
MLNFYRNTIRCVLFINLILTVNCVIAQKRGQFTDSLRRAGKTFILLGDSSILILKDTVIFLNKYDTSSRKYRSYDDLYNSVKSKASASPITRELFRMAFSKPAKPKSREMDDIIKSDNRFTAYEGKKIRNIRILKLDPFGTSVIDTSQSPESWIARNANKLHTSTRDAGIKKALLFHTGDNIIATLLADNERMLRDLPNIRDARILVTVKDSDNADIMVIIKDVWSLALDAKYYNADSVSLKLYDRNILGTGQMLENDVLLNIADKLPVGYSGTYQVNNIAGRYISGRLAYTNAFGVNDKELELSRDLSARAFEYAGGLKLQQSSAFQDNQSSGKIPVSFTYLEAWIGKIIRLGNTDEKSPSQPVLFITGRLTGLHFTERPVVEPDSNYQYFNRTMLLAGITYSKRNYYVGNQIYYSGQTEDIPYGQLLSLSAGREINEFQNRYYGSILMATGGFYRIGFCSINTSLGSFFHYDHFEQGQLSANLIGFSRKLRSGSFAFRQFVNLNYTYGIKRFANEKLSLSNNYGIRGLDGDSIYGNHRLVINLEQVAFLPSAFYGFEITAFTFEDLGAISYTSLVSKYTKEYSGFGAGLRISNQNLFFRTIQISFAWYPGAPAGNREFAVKLTGITYPSLFSFTSGKPEVQDYK